MKRFLLTIVIVLFLFTAQFHSVSAQYAQCDACGYCHPEQVSQTYKQPSRSQECQRCLYPALADNADPVDTLRVDPSTLRPPAPAPGRYWTAIGCVNVSNLGGFQEQGAPGGVVQILLNIIFSASGGIAFLYLLYGSFTIVISRADPEKLNYGRRLVLGAITGLIFSLTSLLVINLLSNQIFKIPSL